MFFDSKKADKFSSDQIRGRPIRRSEGSMRSKTILILFSVCFSYCLARLDICEETCRSTYSIHTNDQVEDLKACLFGCRLSYIVHLMRVSMEPTSTLCDNDCNQAYAGNENLVKACGLGCKWKPISQVQGDFDDLDLMWHRQFFKPFNSLSQYCSNMFNHASSIFVTTTYDDRTGEDSGTVVMQFRYQPSISFSISSTEHHTKGYAESSGDDAEDKQRYSQFFHKVYDHGKRWLDCVQRRLGLPYWFLCFVLMLSFFLITWVCCSSCDDDSRDKETAKKHRFGREIHYDASDIEKVPLFFVNNNNSEEAGPLPSKTPLT